MEPQQKHHRLKPERSNANSVLINRYLERGRIMRAQAKLDNTHSGKSQS